MATSHMQDDLPSLFKHRNPAISRCPVQGGGFIQKYLLVVQRVLSVSECLTVEGHVVLIFLVPLGQQALDFAMLPLAYMHKKGN